MFFHSWVDSRVWLVKVELRQLLGIAGCCLPLGRAPSVPMYRAARLSARGLQACVPASVSMRLIPPAVAVYEESGGCGLGLPHSPAFTFHHHMPIFRTRGWYPHALVYHPGNRRWKILLDGHRRVQT